MVWNDRRRFRGASNNISSKRRAKLEAKNFMIEYQILETEIQRPEIFRLRSFLLSSGLFAQLSTRASRGEKGGKMPKSPGLSQNCQSACIEFPAFLEPPETASKRHCAAFAELTCISDKETLAAKPRLTRRGAKP